MPIKLMMKRLTAIDISPSSSNFPSSVSSATCLSNATIKIISSLSTVCADNAMVMLLLMMMTTTSRRRRWSWLPCIGVQKTEPSARWSVGESVTVFWRIGLIILSTSILPLAWFFLPLVLCHWPDWSFRWSPVIGVIPPSTGLLALACFFLSSVFCHWVRPLSTGPLPLACGQSIHNFRHPFSLSRAEDTSCSHFASRDRLLGWVLTRWSDATRPVRGRRLCRKFTQRNV